MDSTCVNPKDLKDFEGKLNDDISGKKIAIKDNVNVIGTKTTSASKILENYVSPYDATLIRYIKEAGYRNNW